MRNEFKSIRIIQTCHTVMLVLIYLTLSPGSCTAKAAGPADYSVSILDSDGADRNLLIVEVQKGPRTYSFLVHKKDIEDMRVLEAIAETVERSAP